MKVALAVEPIRQLAHQRGNRGMRGGLRCVETLVAEFLGLRHFPGS